MHPNVTGIPWWGAVLTAVVASAIGFAFDAGSGGGQLTAAFSTLYVLGCLIAVLAVQQRGLFTAVIQPPLVLFVTVPGAYFLMHSSEIQGLKDVLINCGYPLIERFPLMFFTSAAVLLIGLGRWYFGKAAKRAAPEAAEERAATPGRSAGLSSKLSSKLSSLLGRRTAGADTDDDDAEDGDPRARRAAERRRTRDAKPAAGRSSRGARPVKRAPSRSRHSRGPETEIIDAVVDDRPRPRRPRPTDDSAGEPRRRSRSSATRSSRESREPREAREPREPRTSRSSRSSREGREPREPRERRTRYESYDREDRYERPVRERPQRRSSYEDRRFDDGGRFGEYDAFDGYGSGSHHPVSRVRYRGEDAEDRTELRARRRAAQRDVDADRWEYDI